MNMRSMLCKKTLRV